MLLFTSCKTDIKIKESLQTVRSSETQLSASGIFAFIDTAAGLVAWYNFNNGGLKDKSIYHNNIEFNNAQLTSDRNGEPNNTYYFTGFNGSIDQIGIFKVALSATR